MTREEVSIQFGGDATKAIAAAEQTNSTVEKVYSKSRKAGQDFTAWMQKEIQKRRAAELADLQERGLIAKAAVDARIAGEEKFKFAKIAIDAQIAAANKARLAAEVAAEKISNDAKIVLDEKYAAAKIAIDSQIAAANAAAGMSPGIGESLIPGNMAAGAGKKALISQAEKEFGGRAIHGVEAVAGGYVFDKATGKLLGKVGQEAVKELRKVGRHSSRLSSVFYELQVLLHEGLAGTWKKFLGSFTRLLGFLGAPALLVAAGTAAIVGPSAWKTYKAQKAAKQSEKDLGEKSKGASRVASRRVETLARMGKISEDDAAKYKDKLAEGGFENVSSVLNATQPFMKAGTIGMQEAANKADKADSARKKNWENIRSEGDAQQNLTNAKFQQFLLEKRMHEMKFGSKQANAALIEQEELRHDIAKGTLEVQKKKNEQLKKERDYESEVIRVKADAAMRISEIGQKENEKYMPTLNELAGRGIFRGQARRAQRDERLAKRAYERGDVSGAQSLIKDRNSIYDSIHARGVVSERDSQREIADINRKMALRLTEMGTKKSPLATTPAMK